MTEDRIVEYDIILAPGMHGFKIPSFRCFFMSTPRGRCLAGRVEKNLERTLRGEATHFTEEQVSTVLSQSLAIFFIRLLENILKKKKIF